MRTAGSSERPNSLTRRELHQLTSKQCLSSESQRSLNRLSERREKSHQKLSEIHGDLQHLEIKLENFGNKFREVSQRFARGVDSRENLSQSPDLQEQHPADTTSQHEPAQQQQLCQQCPADVQHVAEEKQTFNLPNNNPGKGRIRKQHNIELKKLYEKSQVPLAYFTDLEMLRNHPLFRPKVGNMVVSRPHTRGRIIVKKNATKNTNEPKQHSQEASPSPLSRTAKTNRVGVQNQAVDLSQEEESRVLTPSQTRHHNCSYAIAPLPMHYAEDNRILYRRCMCCNHQKPHEDSEIIKEQNRHKELMNRLMRPQNNFVRLERAQCSHKYDSNSKENNKENCKENYQDHECSIVGQQKEVVINGSPNIRRRKIGKADQKSKGSKQLNESNKSDTMKHIEVRYGRPDKSRTRGRETPLKEVKQVRSKPKSNQYFVHKPSPLKFNHKMSQQTAYHKMPQVSIEGIANYTVNSDRQDPPLAERRLDYPCIAEIKLNSTERMKRNNTMENFYNEPEQHFPSINKGMSLVEDKPERLSDFSLRLKQSKKSLFSTNKGLPVIQPGPHVEPSKEKKSSKELSRAYLHRSSIAEDDSANEESRGQEITPLHSSRRGNKRDETDESGTSEKRYRVGSSEGARNGVREVLEIKPLLEEKDDEEVEHYDDDHIQSSQALNVEQSDEFIAQPKERNHEDTQLEQRYSPPSERVLEKHKQIKLDQERGNSAEQDENKVESYLTQSHSHQPDKVESQLANDGQLSSAGLKKENVKQNESTNPVAKGSTKTFKPEEHVNEQLSLNKGDDIEQPKNSAGCIKEMDQNNTNKEDDREEQSQKGLIILNQQKQLDQEQLTQNSLSVEQSNAKGVTQSGVLSTLKPLNKSITTSTTELPQQARSDKRAKTPMVCETAIETSTQTNRQQTNFSTSTTTLVQMQPQSTIAQPTPVPQNESLNGLSVRHVEVSSIQCQTTDFENVSCPISDKPKLSEVCDCSVQSQLNERKTLTMQTQSQTENVVQKASIPVCSAVPRFTQTESNQIINIPPVSSHKVQAKPLSQPIVAGAPAVILSHTRLVEHPSHMNSLSLCSENLEEAVPLIKPTLPVKTNLIQPEEAIIEENRVTQKQSSIECSQDHLLLEQQVDLPIDQSPVTPLTAAAPLSDRHTFETSVASTISLTKHSIAQPFVKQSQPLDKPRFSPPVSLQAAQQTKVAQPLPIDTASISKSGGRSLKPLVLETHSCLSDDIEATKVEQHIGNCFQPKTSTRRLTRILPQQQPEGEQRDVAGTLQRADSLEPHSPDKVTRPIEKEISKNESMVEPQTGLKEQQDLPKLNEQKPGTTDIQMSVISEEQKQQSPVETSNEQDVLKEEETPQTQQKSLQQITENVNPAALSAAVPAVDHQKLVQLRTPTKKQSSEAIIQTEIDSTPPNSISMNSPTTQPQSQQIPEGSFCSCQRKTINQQTLDVTCSNCGKPLSASDILVLLGRMSLFEKLQFTPSKRQEALEPAQITTEEPKAGVAAALPKASVDEVSQPLPHKAEIIEKAGEMEINSPSQQLTQRKSLLEEQIFVELNKIANSIDQINNRPIKPLVEAPEKTEVASPAPSQKGERQQMNPSLPAATKPQQMPETVKVEQKQPVQATETLTPAKPVNAKKSAHLSYGSIFNIQIRRQGIERSPLSQLKQPLTAKEEEPLLSATLPAFRPLKPIASRSPQPQIQQIQQPQPELNQMLQDLKDSSISDILPLKSDITELALIRNHLIVPLTEQQLRCQKLIVRRNSKESGSSNKRLSRRSAMTDNLANQLQTALKILQLYLKEGFITRLFEDAVNVNKQEKAVVWLSKFGQFTPTAIGTQCAVHELSGSKLSVHQSLLLKALCAMPHTEDYNIGQWLEAITGGPATCLKLASKSPDKLWKILANMTSNSSRDRLQIYACNPTSKDCVLVRSVKIITDISNKQVRLVCINTSHQDSFLCFDQFARLYNELVFCHANESYYIGGLPIPSKTNSLERTFFFNLHAHRSTTCIISFWKEQDQTEGKIRLMLYFEHSKNHYKYQGKCENTANYFYFQAELSRGHYLLIVEGLPEQTPAGISTYSSHSIQLHAGRWMLETNSTMENETQSFIRVREESSSLMKHPSEQGPST